MVFDCWLPLVLAFSLTVLYVSSLYIWDSSKGRDHPSLIKKRCISVAFMTIISPLFVKYGISHDNFLQYEYPDAGPFSVLEVMGMRWEGLWNAILYSLTLTVIFFTGPLIFWMTNEFNRLFLDPRVLYHIFTSAIWLRSHLVAPFSEEWTFRACLLPILLQCMSPVKALLIAPLFFGIAHFHHVIERIRLGYPIPAVIVGTLFQITFTSVFGMYSAFLFMKTGHFMAAFVVHIYCNLMGVPDVVGLMSLPRSKQALHLTLHVAGVVGWYFSLPALTESCLFSPVLHYLPDL